MLKKNPQAIVSEPNRLQSSVCDLAIWFQKVWVFSFQHPGTMYIYIKHESCILKSNQIIVSKTRAVTKKGLWHWLSNIGPKIYMYFLSIILHQCRRYESSMLKAKEKYRGVFEIQKSGDKTSTGEIGLHIRTHASPKVGQDQVSGGVSVPCYWKLYQSYHIRTKVLTDIKFVALTFGLRYIYRYLFFSQSCINV